MSAVASVIDADAADSRVWTRQDSAPSLDGLVDPATRSGLAARFGRRPRALRIAFRIIGPFIILGIWQLATVRGWVTPRILPSPGVVVDAFEELIRTGALQRALPVSLQRSGWGFLIGGVIGVSLGLLTGLSRLAEELFDAPLQMIRTIPFIALVPLFMIWFGINEESKIALIAGACIFSNYMNTSSGVRNIDPKLIEAARVFRVSRHRLLFGVVLPNALPSILVGVRYSMGTSLLALVAAEQINAVDGIGFIIANANLNVRTDIVLAGIVVYALLGIGVDLVMRTLERVLLPWKRSRRTTA